MLRSFLTRGLRALCLGTVLITGSVAALAWNPFASNEPESEEVALSAQELSQVQVNAGWAKGDDHTLLFEVRNGLAGPIQCASAQVSLKDGKTVNKTFMPKLFVPPGLTRNASLPHVEKGTMKSYGMACTCFKKGSKGSCINPLRKS
jgi:hypothetical protein